MAKLSKTIKWIIIGIGSVLVLVLALFLLKLTEPKTESVDETSDLPADTTGVVTITDYEAADVVSLKIKNSGGEFTIVRKDDSFEIPLISKAPQNETLIATATGAAASIKTVAIVEEVADDMGKYGLSPAVCEVSVEFSDKTVEFLIGNEAPTGTGSYFALKGSKSVFLVDTAQMSTLLYPANRFITLALTDAKTSEDGIIVKKLTIERADLNTPIVLEAEQEESGESDVPSVMNSHRFTSPVNIAADDGRAKSVVYGMFGLTASEAAYAAPTEAELGLAGINEPTAVITSENSDKTHKLTIGKAYTDESGIITGYYGYYDGIDVIYVFTTDSLPWLSADPSYIMSRVPITPYIYSVDRLIITTPDGENSFEIIGNSDENSVKLNGEEADMTSFKSLYQFIIATYGDEIYTGEVSGEPLAEIRFVYRDGEKPDDVMTFYQAENRKIAIKVNGQVLFTTRQMYIDKLNSNIKAYKEGEKIIIDW